MNENSITQKVKQSASIVNISVCMAAYNGSKYIERQVQSILSQLGRYDELIVVDDCSSDSTAALLRLFQDDRIKILSNQVNCGVVKSFEKAISASTGRLIFLSDQDDIWYPNKVAKITSAFAKYDSLVVVSDCCIIDDSDKIVEPSYFLIRKTQSGFFYNFKKNCYLGCALAFDYRLKKVILPFPKTIGMHDEWIGLVGDAVDQVVFLPEVLFGYRRHSGNVTKMYWGGPFFALKKRFLNAIALASRAKQILKFRKRN